MAEEGKALALGVDTDKVSESPKKVYTQEFRLAWAGTDRYVVNGITGIRYEFYRDRRTAVQSEDVDYLRSLQATSSGCCGPGSETTTVPILEEA